MSTDQRGSLECASVWFRDAAIVGALFAAPLIWGKWGTPRDSAALAIIFCLMAAGWLAYFAAALFGHRELTFVRSPLNLPLLLLLLIAVASTLFASVNRCRSALELYRMACGAMLFWLIANQPPATWRRRLYLAAIILAGAVVAWLGVREYVVQSIIGHNPSWRIFATFLNPNELAGFLSLVIPAAAAVLLWSRTRAMRIVTGFVVALGVIALLLTGSRAGAPSFLIGIFVFGVLAGVAFRRTRLALAVAPVVAVLIVAAAFAVPPLQVRLMSVFTGDLPPSFIFRKLTWQATAAMVRDHPWLGIGPGAFEFAYPAYAVAGFTRMAHQNYLQVAAEMGLPGAVAFVWMLLALFWLAGKAFLRLRDRETRLLCAACIGGALSFSVHSLFEYTWYIGAISFTLFGLFGLVANAAAPATFAAAAAEAVKQPRSEPKPYRSPRRSARIEPSAPAQEPALLSMWRRRLRVGGPARWIALVIAVAVAALAAVGPVSAYLAKAQAEQGRYAVLRGDLLTAEGSYRAAVRLAPGCAEYHRDFGRVIGPPQGIQELERAIELAPTDASNQLALARMYEAVGPWDEAALHYRRALELYPNYLAAYRGFAELEARRGNGEAALALYHRIIVIQHSEYQRYQALETRIETDYAYAHYALGRAALERGDVTGARRELEAALDVLRQWETTPGSLSKMLAAAGESSPLAEREIVALKARVLWRLGQVLTRQGDEREADRLYDEARRLSADVETLVKQEPPLVEKRAADARVAPPKEVTPTHAASRGGAG